MPPRLSYLICATHRTGSTLLCELLKNTGLAGRPEEYFWSGYEPMWKERWGTSTYADYLYETVERTTTPNGVFGAKIMWAHLDEFLYRARQVPIYANIPTPALLSSLFPNLSFLLVTRQDKVRQAVSLWKAIQTQIWEKPIGDTPLPAKQAIYDFDAIDYWRGVIHWQEASWHSFFTMYRITPFTIIYEDFVQSYETTLFKILGHLGIPYPTKVKLTTPNLRRQADEQSEEWVRRFIAEKEKSWNEQSGRSSE